MLTPIAWQEVQEPLLGCLAMAGINAKLVRTWGSEIGCGVKALLYANAATAESAPTRMKAHRKIARGQGRTRSLVGIQLNRILPRRGGVRGCKGDGRPAFSRVRLSQNTFNELAAPDVGATIRPGTISCLVVAA